MSKFIDITGIKFNKLTAIKLSDNKRDKTGKLLWICRCDCGNTVSVTSNKLKTGRIKSCGCLKKLPDGESNLNSLYTSYKRGARNRNMLFELDRERFRELTKGYCFYCGSVPKNKYKNSGCKSYYIYNGIDRVDNTKGYIEDNVVSCCETCNKAKNNHTKEDFIAWILRVYNKVIMKSDFYKFENLSGIK